MSQQFHHCNESLSDTRVNVVHKNNTTEFDFMNASYISSNKSLENSRTIIFIDSIATHKRIRNVFQLLSSAIECCASRLYFVNLFFSGRFIVRARIYTADTIDNNIVPTIVY